MCAVQKSTLYKGRGDFGKIYELISTIVASKAWISVSEPSLSRALRCRFALLSEQSIARESRLAVA